MGARLKVGTAMRFFLLVVSAVIWAGIALSGFQQVHWLLYVPAVFLLFAAISGYVLFPAVIQEIS
jgi:hypothetical protein